MSNPTSFRHLARGVSVAGLLLSFAAPLLVGCAPAVTVVASRAADPQFHTITVTGQGEASARPDLARASLGVEVIAPSVADASSQAAARMNQVLAALKRAGIADKDIRTSNFSVSREQQPDYGMPGPMPYPMPAPMPEMQAPPPPPAPGGRAPKGKPAPQPPVATSPMQPMPYMMPPRQVDVYRVSNTVDVKIRDLAKVGPVLDAAMSAGANTIFGVHFEVEVPDALYAQARTKAAADARTRAEALAKLQGVTLAGVVSINEMMGGGMPYPMPMMNAKMAMYGDGGGGTPASPGEVALTSQVQVVYALKGEGAAKAAETE